MSDAFARAARSEVGLILGRVGGRKPVAAVVFAVDQEAEHFTRQQVAALVRFAHFAEHPGFLLVQSECKTLAAHSLDLIASDSSMACLKSDVSTKSGDLTSFRYE